MKRRNLSQKKQPCTRPQKTKQANGVSVSLYILSGAGERI